MRATARSIWTLIVTLGPLTLQAQEAKVESQLLLPPEPGMQYAISPKGLHVAAVVLRGSRQVLVYDGTDGPRFDQVLDLSTRGGGGKVSWSDDGSRYAYHGKLGQEYVVIVDGKEVSRGPWSPDLQAQGRTPVWELGFSPGSKHWYLITETMTPGRTNYRMLLDGVPGPLSQQVVSPLWSPDGEHHTYIQKIDPGTIPQVRYALIVDGKPAPYLAGDMQWTGDSKHLITKRPIAGANDEVLADGQPLMRVPGGAQLTMAPVGPGMLGRAMATFEGGARGYFLLVGNRKAVGSECTNTGGLDAVYMSPDGKHYAARCAMSFMYIDGKKGQEYPEGISHLVWTADGRPVYSGRTNQRAFMIIGDQESNAYSWILDVPPTTREEQRSYAAAPIPAVVRGTHVAYIARPNANDAMATVVVVDGKAMPSVAASEVSLSPDGTRFAYLSGRHPGTFITVDGTAYDKAAVEPGIGRVGFQGTIHWSPDSKHVAWITAAPNNGVMLDGKLLPTPRMTRFAHFTATGHLVYLARGEGAEHQVYVDGKRVLTLPQNLPLENEADIYWRFGEDGSVSFVAQDNEGMKRYRIVLGGGQ
jgi:WD40 repeat protein